MHPNAHLISRARMYLYVTIACGLSAVLMQLLLSGTGEIKNYAEQRLELAVRDTVRSEVGEVSRSTK